MRIPIPVNFNKLQSNANSGLYDNLETGVVIFSAIIAISFFLFYMYVMVKEKKFPIFTALISSFAIFYVLTMILMMAVLVVASWF